MLNWIKDLNEATGWQYAVYVAAVIVAGGLLAAILLLIKKRIFKRINERKTGLQIAFIDRLLSVVIVVMCIILVFAAFGGLGNIWKTMLGGTAVISAVLAFAAQDVIKDVLAGFMMSAHKPFEVGNRIELEDGTKGVVEDMTMRHIVLKGMDTLRIVIPNHKIGAMKVINYSYRREDKSVHFRFAVSYDTDMELAKRLVGEAVKESPYTKPSRDEEDGTAYYAPPRFLEFADSALMIDVLVYFDKSRATENVTDDINMRVRNKFAENSIEIPYQYVNVITQEAEPKQ
ncbi:MAG: mechanosensitive ion channel family protein [Lachnospiraceae bacterium]|nr:mechanosensitive ion channel family protein [Lachnospiraceae bacterium]